MKPLPERTVADFLPKLLKALDRGGNVYSIDDVASRLREGSAQLWVNGKGMVITTILDFPQYSVIDYWLAAGEMNDVLGLVPMIEQYAKKHGCTAARMIGRRGWKRVLEPKGWGDMGLTVMTKDLT